MASDGITTFLVTVVGIISVRRILFDSLLRYIEITPTYTSMCVKHEGILIIYNGII